MAGPLHGSHRLWSRRTALGQPSSRRHDSEGCLQWLAHTEIPSTVRRLPGQALSRRCSLRSPSSQCQLMLGSWLHSKGFHGLSLPDGQPSPFLHLHVDNTTVHASSPADAQAIPASSVALHIDATEPRLQRSKSSGMGIGCLQHLVGPDPAYRHHLSSAAGTSVRHLGVPLSTDACTAAEVLYTDILKRLQARIARWSGFRLSLLGRAHVAKQVLVAMFSYHGTFISVPEQLLRQLSVYTFVAANRPVVAGATRL